MSLAEWGTFVNWLGAILLGAGLQARNERMLIGAFLVMYGGAILRWRAGAYGEFDFGGQPDDKR